MTYRKQALLLIVTCHKKHLDARVVASSRCFGVDGPSCSVEPAGREGVYVFGTRAATKLRLRARGGGVVLATIV